MLRLGILLHLNWLGVVACAAQGFVLLAALLSGITSLLSLRMHPDCSLRMGAVALFIGLAGDVGVVALGGLEFTTGVTLLPVPLWMGGLWLAFGTTLPAFASFFSRRMWLAPLLGVAGGVGAYTSASSFGAVDIGAAGRLTMVSSVGLMWGLVFPLLIYLSKRKFR